MTERIILVAAVILGSLVGELPVFKRQADKFVAAAKRAALNH